MKEYWVNVYDRHYYGMIHIVKANAVEASDYEIKRFSNKTLYRIHVKMKPILPLDLKEVHERFFQR